MKLIVQPLLFCLLLSSGWMNLSDLPAQAQLSPDLMTLQSSALPTPPPGPVPPNRRRGGASY